MAEAGSRGLGVPELHALLVTCVQRFVQHKALRVVSRFGGEGADAPISLFQAHSLCLIALCLISYWHAAAKLRGLVVLLCGGDLGVHARCL